MRAFSQVFLASLRRADMEPKRATTQRKRACADLRDLMVDVGVDPPSESRSELTKQTFSNLAHEAGFDVRWGSRSILACARGVSRVNMCACVRAGQ